MARSEIECDFRDGKRPAPAIRLSGLLGWMGSGVLIDSDGGMGVGERVRFKRYCRRISWPRR